MLADIVKAKGNDAKLIFDIGDPFWGNSARKTGFLMDILTKHYEKKYLSLADAIIVTNMETKTHYIETYGDTLEGKHIAIISQGADIQETYDGATTIVSDECLRLVYAGQFYDKLREPFELFEAVNNYRTFPVVLDLYGPISSRFLVGYSDRDHHACINYKGVLPHNMMAQVYREASALVFIDNAYGVQMSGKLFELIAMKKPILFIYSNEHSLSLQIIRTYPGAIISRNSACEIMSTLSKLRSTSLHFDFDMTPYSWENKSNELSALLMEIACNK